MLTAMRRLAGTWPARLLFLLLLASFLVWGIEDVVRNFGRDSAVARVGDESIELPEAQAAARREVARIARQLGNRFEPNEDIRRAVAATALERLIAQYALRNEATHLGLAAPDAVVRDAVFAIPGLRGAVRRASRLRFRGVDMDGRPVEGEAAGIVARVMQHETDHLDGILYPMRMEDLSLFGFTEELTRAANARAAAKEG